MMASALDVNTSVIINAKMTIEFSPWVEPVVQTGRYALLVVQKQKLDATGKLSRGKKTQTWFCLVALTVQKWSKSKGVISAEFHTQLNSLSEHIKIELLNRKTRQKGAQTLQIIDVIY